MLGQDQILQTMIPQVPEGRIGRERVSNECHCGGREQNLVTMTGSGDASNAVEGMADVHAVTRFDDSCMDTHPDLYSKTFPPRLSDECAAGGNRSGKGISWVSEGRMDGITHGPKHHASMRGKQALQERIVAGN